MSAAAHDALVESYHKDIFQNGDLAVADQILTPDFVWHSPGIPPELLRGPEGMKQFASIARNAFPDQQITHDDTISVGDKVVIRWTVRATHQGEFMGIPPTGKSFTVSNADTCRFTSGGRICEHWGVFDSAALMRQLGVGA